MGVVWTLTVLVWRQQARRAEVEGEFPRALFLYLLLVDGRYGLLP
jgi:hypothetical protein